jgi:hypothetical protein
MLGPTVLFLIVLATVLIIRLSVKLVPDKDIKLFGIIIHHFWIGVCLVLIGWLMPNIANVSILTFGIGIGLIADHLIYMIIGAGGDKEYWTKASLVGAGAMLVLVFIFRTHLYSLFLGG